MALYHGWDVDAMRTAGDYGALYSDTTLPSSSFAAINKPQTRNACAPLPAAATPPSTVEPGNGGNSQNPAIVRYLGLDAEALPSHIEKYALFLPSIPQSQPRQPKLSRKKLERNKADQTTSGKTSPKQKRVSEGLSVTKAVSRKRVLKDHSGIPSHPNACHNISVPSSTVRGDPHLTSAVPTVSLSGHQTSTLAETQKAQPTPPNVLSYPSSYLTPGSNLVHTAREPSSPATIADDEFDDIFNSIDLDHIADPVTTDAQLHSNQGLYAQWPDARNHLCCYNAEGTNLDDSSLLTSNPGLTVASSLPFPSSAGERIDRSVQMPAMSASTLLVDAFRSSRLAGPSRRFVSPMTPKARRLIEKTKAEAPYDRKPIVRPPFPALARNRSPIIGLSTSMVLRICFRIGEVIKQAHYATKHGQDVLFELYARVSSSSRDEAKQHFVFGDLFHNNPPYIKATYDATIWRQVQLFDADSRRLLTGEGQICRCIGKVKRDGKEWRMVVLNIWGADWDDVALVEGIVAS